MVEKGHQFITEDDIKNIHKIVLAGIDDDWAGKYRLSQVFITGAPQEPPGPDEVPFRMKKLIEWLKDQQGVHPARVAADLHYRFVVIHPFVDGNGRTTRLLMNLVLIQNGYPIAIIKTEEREAYIDAIRKATVTGNPDDFYSLVFGAVERSLDAYIAAAKGKSIIPFFIEKTELVSESLLQIGKIATLANVAIPTVRYYLEQGFIKPETKSKGGFMLFDPKVVEKIKEIKRLQKEERLSIAELKKRLS
ncbi:MAG: Fic [Candidatus Curtissbacteria bacterium GW2011_GWA1_40_16]|uniref:Fic n=1 Tax=Candidatus Curtissbacteria bacterium GW2011_GWA1_40_16 TaxID=1618405 RepID=A0A0G0RD05_9BACT|nr:MAG: Fic [Candidatus Curtissbacteria bacterium GW2011_GWA1_40_16]